MQIESPFTVLALNGGGIRGLYTAVLLRDLCALLAKETGKDGTDIGRNFHLITGTSTGGILGCGLAAGVPTNRIVELYEQKGPLIFADPMPVDRGGKIRWGIRNRNKAANSPEPLKQALVEIFGNRTLAEIYADREIALCIPASRMLDEKPKVFKTPHLKRYGVDGGVSVVDVCLATSAAPIFLPLHQINCGDDGGRAFADGGLWANNPTLVGLLEALEICHRAEGPDERKRPIEILSLGTCSVPVGDPPHVALDRGIVAWQLGVKTTSLAMNTQSAGTDYMSRLLAQRITELGRNVTIVRIDDPRVSQEQAAHLQLDLATPEAIQLLKQLGSSRAQAVLSDASDPRHQDGQFIKRILTQHP
jgi:hypothetical protein